MSRAQGNIVAFQRQAKAVTNSIRAMAKKASFFIGVGVAAALGLAVKEAIELETQIAEIAKLTEDVNLAQAIAGDIRDLATRLPVAQEELLEIAETAARLGIQGRSQIQEFTRTVGLIGVATNLSADKAAGAMARITKAIGLPIGEVRNLASAINFLSNNIARSFSEIVEATQRAAPALGQLGATAPVIATLAGKLAEVSASSRRAGTRLRSLAQSLGDPDRVQTFAKALGTTAEGFRDLRDISPGVAILELAERMKEGGDAARLLSSEVRRTARTALAGLATNLDETREQMDEVITSMQEGTSLIDEAAEFFGIAASEIQVFVNQLKAAAQEAGRAFLPALNQLLAVVRRMIPLFRAFAQIVLSLPARVVAATTAFLTLATVLGALTATVTSLAGALGGAGLGGTLAGLVGALGGPIPAAIVGVTSLLGALGAAAVTADNQMADLEAQLRKAARTSFSLEGALADARVEVARMMAEAGREEAIELLERQIKAVELRMKLLAEQTKLSLAELGNFTLGMLETSRAAKQMAPGMVALGESVSITGDAALEAANALRFLGIDLSGSGQRSEEVRDKLKRLRQELQNFLESLRGGSGGAESFREDLKSLSTIFEELRTKARFLGEGFDFTEEAIAAVNQRIETLIDNGVRAGRELRSLRNLRDVLQLEAPSIVPIEELVPIESIFRGAVQRRIDRNADEIVQSLRTAGDRIRSQLKTIRQALEAADPTSKRFFKLQEAQRRLEQQLRELTQQPLSDLERKLARAGRRAGAQLIEGIILGAENLEDQLKRFLARLAAEVITAQLFGLLGIGSPSKVGINIGRSIVEGIEVGMAQRSSSLARTARRVASIPTNAMAGAGMRASVAVAGAGVQRQGQTNALIQALRNETPNPVTPEAQAVDDFYQRVLRRGLEVAAADGHDPFERGGSRR